jgi:TolB-like protein
VRFWQELRRRRVFRLAGLYIFGAWALIQVADISFPAWGLPETALRYLFIAAIAGFPIALIFSWFYDITPQGIVRTDPAGEAEAVDLSLKRVDYVVLAALLAIGVTIVLGSLGKIQEEIETGAALTSRLEKMANSLAVLPFTNLDTNPDTAYFSDGITEEILHRLSTMRVLHVLASTSSFAFRDSEETPSSISDRLGVRYLLQGSVRRDGDYVRVTARLLDESGFQVWSDRFDRKMESIFVIQAEIAGTVSSQILNEIVPPKELPAGRTTENMEAYNAYLKGRAYFDARTAGWKERAEEAFRRAIELDPGYAPPYAGLATLPVNTGFGPQWEAARDSALKSLELDPELPLGHAALGLALAAFGENERSAESLRRAIDLDPALAIAHTWITVPLHRLGLHEEARAMEERGLEIDPLSPVLIRNLAGNESNRGNMDRAEKLLLRLAGLPEPPFWIFDSLRVLYSDWGRYADAVESAKNDARLSARYGGDQRPETIASGYTALGLVEDAEYWFEVALGLWEGDEPPVASIYSFAMEGARKPWWLLTVRMISRIC